MVSNFCPKKRLKVLKNALRLLKSVTMTNLRMNKLKTTSKLLSMASEIGSTTKKTMNLSLVMKKKSNSQILKLRVNGFMMKVMMLASKNTKKEDMNCNQASLNSRVEKLHLMSVLNSYPQPSRALTTGAIQLTKQLKARHGSLKTKRRTFLKKSTRPATGWLKRCKNSRLKD